MGIRISEEHGVNPSLDICFYCGEARGVVLFGKMRPTHASADPEAPRRVCLDKVPCDKCRAFMDRGIICVGVDEERSDDPENPYRDGNWCVVTEDFIRRVLTPDMANVIAKSRVAFLPGEIWRALGLPQPASRRKVED